MISDLFSTEIGTVLWYSMYFKTLRMQLDCKPLNYTSHTPSGGEVKVQNFPLELHWSVLGEWRRLLGDSSLNPQELVEFLYQCAVIDNRYWNEVVKQYRGHLELREPKYTVFVDSTDWRWRQWDKVREELKEWRSNRS